MQTPNTSPLRNKIVCIYNALFFIELLCYMHQYGLEEAVDESGTLWHIEDVKDILQYWEAA